MHVRILGSSSGEPVPNRNASAYLVSDGTLRLLLDAGDGVAQQLVRFKEESCSIDAVFISHMHPDHAGGLFLLLQRMVISRRSKPLILFLPGGILPGFLDVFPYFNIFMERLPFIMNIKPVAAGILFSVQGTEVHALSNGHVAHYAPYAAGRPVRPESFSFTITGPDRKSFIYTGDIDNLAELNEAASDCSLILSECTHVSPDDVLEFAGNHSIPRVIFSHIPPELEDRIISIRSPRLDVQVAEDGEIVEV
jgi:ribonuclease BN (tRNA processing enzyme)